MTFIGERQLSTSSIGTLDDNSMMTLDHWDRIALADAYRKHLAAHERLEDRQHFTENERVRNEVQYFETQHDLDVICERLEINYGDDVASLEDLIEPEITGEIPR